MARKNYQIEKHDIRFAALRNAHYHLSRQAWFDRWNRLFNVLIIASGTALAWQISQQNEAVGVVVAISTTVIGSLQLVLDLGGQARNHEFLKRRYFEVLAEIEKLENPSQVDKSRLKAQLLSLSAEEPPTYWALDAIAYNQIVHSMYGVEGKEHRCLVSWWQLRTRHILYYAGVNFTDPEKKGT